MRLTSNTKASSRRSKWLPQNGRLQINFVARRRGAVVEDNFYNKLEHPFCVLTHMHEFLYFPHNSIYFFLVKHVSNMWFYMLDVIIGWHTWNCQTSTQQKKKSRKKRKEKNTERRVREERKKRKEKGQKGKEGGRKEGKERKGGGEGGIKKKEGGVWV